MTIREGGDVVIWVGAISGALVAILAFLHLAVVRPARHWLGEQINQLFQAQQQAAATAQGSNETLGEIRDELHQTNKLALRNQVQVLEQARRLDQHLIEHHPLKD